MCTCGCQNLCNITSNFHRFLLVNIVALLTVSHYNLFNLKELKFCNQCALWGYASVLAKRKLVVRWDFSGVEPVFDLSTFVGSSVLVGAFNFQNSMQLQLLEASVRTFDKIKFLYALKPVSLSLRGRSPPCSNLDKTPGPPLFPTTLSVTSGVSTASYHVPPLTKEYAQVTHLDKVCFCC